MPVPRHRPGNRPHRVTLCRHARPGRGSRDDGSGSAGGRLALFAFSWADLAVLMSKSERSVRDAARTGLLDPRDLESVAAYWARLGRWQGVDFATPDGLGRWAQDARTRNLDSCTYCGAGVQRPCSQPSGKVRVPHRGRKARTP